MLINIYTLAYDLVISMYVAKRLLMPMFIGCQDFLGYYEFRSKTHQDEFSPEGLCRAAMFALFVKEELELWPEQSTRNRSWLDVSEALESLRHAWMRDALECFCKWHEDKLNEMKG